MTTAAIPPTSAFSFDKEKVTSTGRLWQRSSAGKRLHRSTTKYSLVGLIGRLWRFLQPAPSQINYKVGEACSLQTMNRKAFIRKKASIPLEYYLDVVSTILAKRTKWKANVPSVAVQAGICQPRLTEGEEANNSFGKCPQLRGS